MENKLTIGDRAKSALIAYNQTGQGLTALSSFVFPTGVNFGGNTGLLGSYLSLAPRNFPYGDVNAYNSSIVMSCVNWSVRGFREAIFRVYRETEEGDKKYLPKHRLVQFLKRPNPYYTFNKLIGATLISYYLDGNAYWFKERRDGGSGATRALYYIPHYLIEPKTTEGNFTTYYEYNVNGKTYRIPPERIVHFRYELDPYNPLKGRKPLEPVLSEVYTDEEAARFAAALLRNMAIPGVIISPDEKVKLGTNEALGLKENYKRKFGGDNRGEPLIMNFAAKVFTLGFSPEDLNFKELRRLPEERVAAQLGIAPIVCGLGAGLDKGTYSNYEQAERSSYQNNLVPLWTEIGDEIELQLAPEFFGGVGGEDTRVEFDYSKVRALQESTDAIAARTSRLWTTDVIDRAETRAANGFVVEESRDRGLFYSDIRRSLAPQITKPGDNSNEPKKTLLTRASYLLKASGEDDLDRGYDMMLEADVKNVSGDMEGELDGLYEKLGTEAYKLVKENLDRYSPEAESSRLTNEIVKAAGLALLLRAIWGGAGKALEEATVLTISLRLGFSPTEIWDAETANAAKSSLNQLVNSYESAVIEQTRKAIAEAIKGAEDGESVAQIGKRIKRYVSGEDMYPGIYKKGYEEAIEAGATPVEAERAGAAKARRYRANLVAETEVRSYQNAVIIESLEKAGVTQVKVTDGDGCGWKNHDDDDKAHNTVRPLAEARKYSLVHPRCKRRFYPVKP